MKEFLSLYKMLEEKYGVQNWWPTTPKGKVLPAYKNSNRKLKEHELVEIAFGAILTQNTSWANVEKALINTNQELKKQNRELSIEFLHNLKQTELAKLIKPAGFFNQKAKYIHNLTSHIMQNHKGSLLIMFDRQLEDLRSELLSLKGIGKETADSIILYAANKPVFVIDMYTKRLFSRLGYLSPKEDYGAWQDLFHSNLKKDTRLFNEYHALIVEHNKRYCTAKPLCKDCFLQNDCEYAEKSK